MMIRNSPLRLTKTIASLCTNNRLNSMRKMGTILENCIRITFVDHEGNRATVPAKIGSTLLDAARLHKVDLEGPCRGGGGPTEVIRTPSWTETTYGEGASCFYCNVQIPASFRHLLTPLTPHDVEGLKFVWEEEYSLSSYLACQITLAREHDGLVVYVPDPPITEII